MVPGGCLVSNLVFVVLDKSKESFCVKNDSSRQAINGRVAMYKQKDLMDF